MAGLYISPKCFRASDPLASLRTWRPFLPERCHAGPSWCSPCKAPVKLILKSWTPRCSRLRRYPPAYSARSCRDARGSNPFVSWGGSRHLMNWPRQRRGPDATLRLLELELPNWVVRRLIREGDDWLCTLSRQPNLPIALDDPVEGVHATLPLAILRALVDARRRLSTEVRPASWIPQIRPASGIPVCCDNFA